MYGVIGEDRSDAHTLATIVERLAGLSAGNTQRKGFGGCGEMLNKGARQLKLFHSLGCRRFVVAYDADGEHPGTREKVVREKIVRPSQLGDVCVLIPVQEIEAWILADLPAVRNVIKSWTPAQIDRNPETIPKAKEHLEFLSRAANKKPRYSHALHNEKVAQHLDLDRVYSRCESFRPLQHFIRNG